MKISIHISGLCCPSSVPPLVFLSPLPPCSLRPLKTFFSFLLLFSSCHPTASTTSYPSSRGTAMHTSKRTECCHITVSVCTLLKLFPAASSGPWESQGCTVRNAEGPPKKSEVRGWGGKTTLLSSPFSAGEENLRSLAGRRETRVWIQKAWRTGTSGAVSSRVFWIFREAHCWLWEPERSLVAGRENRPCWSLLTAGSRSWDHHTDLTGEDRKSGLGGGGVCFWPLCWWSRKLSKCS